jgi:site-specific recombinase XerD
VRRAKGTGCTYQPRYKDPKTRETRKSRTWWIRYHVPGKARPEQENAHTLNRQDAEKLLRTRLVALDAGDAVGPSVDRTTWADLKTIIRNDYKAHGRRSGDRLEVSLGHLDKSFADSVRANAITADRITGHVARRLEEKAARASVNRELAALKRAFRLAARARRVAFLPAIDLLTESNARKGFFEWHQFVAIRKRLPEDLRGVVTMAYETGWRMPSEILPLERRRVDLHAGWIRLEPGETKSEEGRQFPITPELRRVLEEQERAAKKLERAGRIVPWVFHHDGAPLFYVDRKGHYLASVYFRESWADAARAAGVPARIPHDFRRTAVRNLERAGVSRSAAMKMVGHKTESVYRRYAIVDEATLREAAAKLAKLKRGR